MAAQRRPPTHRSAPPPPGSSEAARRSRRFVRFWDWREGCFRAAKAVIDVARESPDRRLVSLVVDDYDDARATVREMLEELGHEVVEAENGQEAFDYVISHPDVRVQLIGT